MFFYYLEVQQCLTSTASFQASLVELRHEVPNVTDVSDLVEENFQGTTTNDLNINPQSVKNDMREFLDPQQESEMMVALNECETAYQKEKIFCIGDEDKQVRPKVLI